MQPLFSFVVVICVVFTLATADYRQDSLAVHNEYRRKHHAPPLALNATLNNYALKWAKHMAAYDEFEHNTERKYGENIAMNPNLKLSDSEIAKAATTSWFNEYKVYSFDNKFSMATGHFTQVVWKDSKYLGIGIARSKKAAYVCANYDPPGNYKGKFVENVLRP